MEDTDRISKPFLTLNKKKNIFINDFRSSTV